MKKPNASRAHLHFKVWVSLIGGVRRTSPIVRASFSLPVEEVLRGVRPDPASLHTHVGMVNKDIL